MINRAAIILKYKEPAVQWINDADPYDENPGITAAEVNDERTIYLISDRDGDTKQTIARWLKRNWKHLFETELESWYVDSTLWPKDRTLKMFRSWFEVECHTVLIDTVGDPIYDDDI